MIVTMWAGHTARSQTAADCVRGAFAALGWKEVYAAKLMGLTLSQLSRQLAGVDPLNLWRLAELPDAFQAEYDKRRAGLRAATVLEAPDLALIRGACALGKKRMATFTKSVTLPLNQERVS